MLPHVPTTFPYIHSIVPRAWRQSYRLAVCSNAATVHMACYSLLHNEILRLVHHITHEKPNDTDTLTLTRHPKYDTLKERERKKIKSFSFRFVHSHMMLILPKKLLRLLEQNI